MEASERWTASPRAMEANREDALKSLAVAVAAHERGDAEKALRFARKSDALYPTSESAELIQRVTAAASSSAGAPPAGAAEAVGGEGATGATSATGATHGAAGAEAGGTAADAAAAASAGASGGASSAADATAPAASASAVPESPGAALVRHVLTAADHYAVFGVDRQVEDQVVRKIYRKYAMQLHPDKNTSPGAEDAFKIVAEAMQTLNDQARRYNYNATIAKKQWDKEQSARQQKAKRAAPQPVPPWNPTLPPGVPAQAFFVLRCPSCGLGMQIALPNHVGYQSMFYPVVCPTCRLPSQAEVKGYPPMPQPSHSQPHVQPAAKKGGGKATKGGANAPKSKEKSPPKPKPKPPPKRAPPPKKKRRRVWQSSSEDEDDEVEVSEVEEVSEEEEEEESSSEGGVKSEDEDDGTHHTCWYCNEYGEMICCDKCPRVFHFECLIPPMRKSDMPEGDWFCPICVAEQIAKEEAAKLKQEE